MNRSERIHGVKLQTEQNILLKTIVEAIGNKKGFDIKKMHVKDLVNYADYLILCSGASDPQVRAIADEIESKVKESTGSRPILNRKDINWYVLDYIDVVVHIFKPESRTYYDLDTLWIDAPQEKMNV